MRHKMSLHYLSVALIALTALTALGVNSSAAQTDSSIEAFWTKFKTAVISGDQNTVATMVQFPIEMSYGVPAIRTKTQLLKRYRALFGEQADAKKCFATAKPEIEASKKNAFSVACKDASGEEVVIYGFVKTRGVWKLKSLDNINE